MSARAAQIKRHSKGLGNIASIKRGFEGKGWAWKFKESVSLMKISTGDSKMSVELEDFTNVK